MWTLMNKSKPIAWGIFHEHDVWSRKFKEPNDTSKCYEIFSKKRLKVIVSLDDHKKKVLPKWVLWGRRLWLCVTGKMANSNKRNIWMCDTHFLLSFSKRFNTLKWVETCFARHCRWLFFLSSAASSCCFKTKTKFLYFFRDTFVQALRTVACELSDAFVQQSTIHRKNELKALTHEVCSEFLLYFRRCHTFKRFLLLKEASKKKEIRMGSRERRHAK